MEIRFHVRVTAILSSVLRTRIVTTTRPTLLSVSAINRTRRVRTPCTPVTVDRTRRGITGLLPFSPVTAFHVAAFANLATVARRRFITVSPAFAATAVAFLGTRAPALPFIPLTVYWASAH